jgi:hypothetical protein
VPCWCCKYIKKIFSNNNTNEQEDQRFCFSALIRTACSDASYGSESCTFELLVSGLVISPFHLCSHPSRTNSTSVMFVFRCNGPGPLRLCDVRHLVRFESRFLLFFIVVETYGECGVAFLHHRCNINLLLLDPTRSFSPFLKYFRCHSSRTKRLNGDEPFGILHSLNNMV